ncbi:hypothetical protein CDAR_380251 [Caerostris darwini]|uniref:Uncharacterized protein n=1 Tax=Caerostris darwini TaxID=1538125 RepID=A0AAV4TLE9_9ARAC|nr:hypothetical protein CDAR_380251 [Caerostris darwini]
MDSANKFEKEKKITTEVDINIVSERQGHAVDACSRYIAEESDATNLLFQGSLGFVGKKDNVGDADLIKSESVTRQISSKDQSLQKVHHLRTAGWPSLGPAGLPPPPDTAGLPPPPDTAGLPPPPDTAGLPTLVHAGFLPLNQAGLPHLGYALLTSVPHAGFHPLSTAEVNSKADRLTVKKESLKILAGITSVYNETCRSNTRLPALLQGDIVELVELIRYYFSHMQEKLEKFSYFYAAFYIELWRMHTTPETQQEIDSIRRTCSTSLIRVKNTLHSWQTASKIFEMFNKQYVRAYVNKVKEMSAEVVHVMGEEVTRMRTVISNGL